MAKKKCMRCGKDIGFMSSVEVERKRYCKECSEAVERKLEEESRRREEVTLDQTNHIICTTTPTVDGYEITEYVSIINAQVILGVASGAGESSKGRALDLEKDLRAGFRLANEDLKKEAFLANANAVVGVSFDGDMEMAGQLVTSEKKMVISATGTAVNIEKAS